MQEQWKGLGSDFHPTLLSFRGSQSPRLKQCAGEVQREAAMKDLLPFGARRIVGGGDLFVGGLISSTESPWITTVRLVTIESYYSKIRYIPESRIYV